jgi:hypothetical protein
MKVLLTAAAELAFGVATTAFAQSPAMRSYQCVPTASSQEGSPPNTGGGACSSGPQRYAVMPSPTRQQQAQPTRQSRPFTATGLSVQPHS